VFGRQFIFPTVKTAEPFSCDVQDKVVLPSETDLVVSPKGSHIAAAPSECR